MEIKPINGYEFQEEFRRTRENIYALLTSNMPFIDELLLRYSDTYRYYKNHDNEALRAYKCMLERLYMILSISFIVEFSLGKLYKDHFTVMDLITDSVDDIDSVIADTFDKVKPKFHLFGDDNMFMQFDYLINRYQAFPRYNINKELMGFADIMIHAVPADHVIEASKHKHAYKLHDFDLDNILKTLDDLHYTI